MRNRTTTLTILVALAMLVAACSTASDAVETTVAEATPTVAAPPTTEPPPDPAEIAAETQQANIDAFLSQDLDGMMATYADEVEFFNDAMGTHWSGKVQYKPKLAAILKITDTDATELIDNFVSDDGTRGVTVMHWIGENGRGNPFDLTYAQVHEYEDGLISKSTMYWENQDVADQLNAGY